MRKSIVLILVTLITNLGYTQTKQETLDWLNSKLYEYGDSTMGIFSITTVDYEGEEIIGIHQYSYHLGTSNYFIFPRSVKDVVTTKSCRTDGNRCVVIQSFDDYIVRSSNGVPTTETEVTLYGTATPDAEIFKIQKALKHLLKLLGNNIPDKKDLF